MGKVLHAHSKKWQWRPRRFLKIETRVVRRNLQKIHLCIWSGYGSSWHDPFLREVVTPPKSIMIMVFQDIKEQCLQHHHNLHPCTHRKWYGRLFLRLISFAISKSSVTRSTRINLEKCNKPNTPAIIQTLWTSEFWKELTLIRITIFWTWKQLDKDTT